jgi:hypothetical protein
VSNYEERASETRAKLFQAHGSKTAKKSSSAFPAHTRSGLTEKAKDTKNAANGLF